MKIKWLFFVTISFMLTSCVVSKKKYEEMEYAKRRCDAKVLALDKENSKKNKQIDQLNTKLDQTLSEFNEMKNSMAESNAKKNTEIDELSTELMGLTSDTTALKLKLTETLDKYNRLINQNSDNVGHISNLKKQIANLKADSTKLAQELKTAGVEAEWDKKKLESEKQNTATKVAQKDQEIAALMEEIKEKDGKLGWLRKVQTKNKEEIERLTNQVKLYKTEYEKAIGNK